MNETLDKLLYKLILLSEAENILRIPVQGTGGRRSTFDVYVDPDVLPELQRRRYRWRQVGSFITTPDPDGHGDIMLSEVILGRGYVLSSSQSAEAGNNYLRTNLERILGIASPAAFVPGPNDIPVYPAEPTAAAREREAARLQVMTPTEQFLHISSQQSATEPLFYVQVDPQDVARVRQHEWRQSSITDRTFQPHTIINRVMVTLSAFILQEATRRVDQRVSGSNYRRANLRTRVERTQRRISRAAQIRSQVSIAPSSTPTPHVDILLDSGWTLIVDPDMENYVRRYTWRIDVLPGGKSQELRTFRVERFRSATGEGNSRRVFLERVIMGLQDPDTGEERGLGRRESIVLRTNINSTTRVANYQRSNLDRVNAQSLRAGGAKKGNALSPYLGVAKDRNLWAAIIRVGTRRSYDVLGAYENEVDAARRRDREVIALGLDQADPRTYRLNFPRSQYENEPEYPHYTSIRSTRNPRRRRRNP